MKRSLSFMLLAALLIGSGCTKELSPDVYSEGAVGSFSETHEGVIVNMRKVTVKSRDRLSQNETGAFVGAASGAVVGSLADQGDGIVGGVIGALAGGAIGAVVEDEASSQEAIEYVVRLTPGGLVTIVQGLEPALEVGQNVYVLKVSGGRSRIISREKH